MNLSTARLQLRPIVIGLLAALLIPACGTSGPKKYQVTGRVTRGGKPLEVNAMTGKLVVTFVPIVENSKELVDPNHAVIEATTGKFKVPGTDGKGIAGGKYRVCISQYDPFPTTDKLQGKFAEGKSPIIREIKGDEDIEIDIDKPNG